MDAFNHSNPFESHVIYVRDYRNDHIRLFTIKQADFDTIKLPLHLTSDTLAPALVIPNQQKPTGAGGECLEQQSDCTWSSISTQVLDC